MMTRWFVAGFALSLFGCEPRSEVFQDGPSERPVARPSTPTHGGPRDGASPVPTTIATPSFAAKREEAVEKMLSDANREEIARSPVPVLVVNDPKLIASAVVTTGPHWYAISARDGGLTVALHGTRLAHEHADIPPARGSASVRGHAAFFTENEGIVTASWVEDGVAYALDLECHDREDERCRGTRHLTRLAERLAYVGGSAAKAGGSP